MTELAQLKALKLASSGYYFNCNQITSYAHCDVLKFKDKKSYTAFTALTKQEQYKLIQSDILIPGASRIDFKSRSLRANPETLLVNASKVSKVDYIFYYDYHTNRHLLYSTNRIKAFGILSTAKRYNPDQGYVIETSYDLTTVYPDEII